FLPVPQILPVRSTLYVLPASPIHSVLFFYFYYNTKKAAVRDLFRQAGGCCRTGSTLFFGFIFKASSPSPLRRGRNDNLPPAVQSHSSPMEKSVLFTDLLLAETGECAIMKGTQMYFHRRSAPQRTRAE
ncbi:MAG: hypothetical protein IJY28_06165, partial [Clostridia bacterium]|nr:hypothetical protein [Clostridia bacterium]